MSLNASIRTRFRRYPWLSAAARALRLLQVAVVVRQLSRVSWCRCGSRPRGRRGGAARRQPVDVRHDLARQRHLALVARLDEVVLHVDHGSAWPRGRWRSNGAACPSRVHASREACEIAILCIGVPQLVVSLSMTQKQAGSSACRQACPAVGNSGSIAAAPLPTYRQAAGRRAHHPQLLSEIRSLSRRRGARHPPPARAQARRGDPERAYRRGQDGHHGRTQCAARAQGDRTLLLITKGFRDALRIGYQPAEDLRQAHHQARHAVRARRRRSTNG